MNKIRNMMARLQIARDERGLSTVEYVIILVLVAVMSIGVWRTFGTKVYTRVSDSNKAMEKDVVPTPKQ